MVKSELLQKLCNLHPNLLRKDVEKILEVILYEIADALYRRENIENLNQGSLYLRNQLFPASSTFPKETLIWKH